MTEERYRPVLHDVELGRRASASWLVRRLGKGGRPRVRGLNLGLDPQLDDGDAVELEPCSPTELRVGDVVLVERPEGLRLLRVHALRGEELLAKADVEPDLVELAAEQVLARARGLGSRVQAFSSRFAPFVHRWVRDSRHHRRHFLPDARAADRSVERRYEDPACVAGYVRKASMGFTDEEASLVERHLAPTGRVLVGGCAAGRLSLAFAERGHEVVGLDLSEPMLREARRISEGRSIEHVLGRLEDLPPGLGRFDAVMLGFFVHGNVPGRANRIAMLRRLHAVLEPGAGLLLSVRRYRDLAHWLRLNGGLLLHGGPSRELGDYSGYDLDANFEPLYFYYHFFTQRELAAELRAGGFEPREQAGVFAAARRVDEERKRCQEPFPAAGKGS